MQLLVKLVTLNTCYAVLGKAGASRWRGVRPTVRGTAMNPVDHPHGGGEGRNFWWQSPSNTMGRSNQG